MKVRQLTLLGLLGAVTAGAQVAMAPLPNIEPVSLLFALFTLTLGGRRALAISYVFVLLEGLIFGFGLWWFTYLYIWAVLIVLVHLFRRVEHPFIWAVILGGYGLLFGLLSSLSTLVIGGPKAALAYFISGIPFDLLHCAGNFGIALVLIRPLRRLFTRLSEALFPREKA